MYNPTFATQTLADQLRKSDFKGISHYNSNSFKEAKIISAANIARTGIDDLQLSSNTVSGMQVYQTDDLSLELVLRKAVKNIWYITRIRQSSRVQIIHRLKLLLKEGIPYFVGKFDIQKFYESINVKNLQEIVNRRFHTAPSTRFVLSSFLDHCVSLEINGLPRGLAISAALSELYLNDFDSQVRNQLNAYYYARYVDDFVVIREQTADTEKLYETVKSLLPKGLYLNQKKTKLHNFYVGSNSQQKKTIEFLGYSFDIQESCNSQKARKLKLDMAQSKIGKRKTRIVRSFLQYLIDRNFEQLQGRIKLLAYNYKFYDSRNSRFRYSGIFHDYSQMDPDANGLRELDLFLRRIILSKTGKVCEKLSKTLSRKQKRQLLSISFVEGYRKKVHISYPPSELIRLIRCWKYV